MADGAYMTTTGSGQARNISDSSFRKATHGICTWQSGARTESSFNASFYNTTNEAIRNNICRHGIAMSTSTTMSSTAAPTHVFRHNLSRNLRPRVNAYGNFSTANYINFIPGFHRVPTSRSPRTPGQTLLVACLPSTLRRAVAGS